LNTLTPYLPHQAGESVVSFLGRLANFHCVPNPRLFCRMIGVDFRRAAYGDPVEVAKLATCAGISANGLREAAAQRGSNGWTLRGQQVGHPVRGLRRICPHCLADDIAHSDLPANAAAYERTVWTLDYIGTCPIHQIALVRVGDTITGGVSLEFCRSIESALENLQAFIDQAQHRKPSPLEQYLLRRLINSEEGIWLDVLEWWAAAETCQALGTLALYGRETYKNDLKETDLHKAGAAGFEIAGLGPESILAFFRVEQHKNKGRSRKSHHSAMTLGTLHHWMVRRQTRSEFEPICEIFREHLVTTRPYAAGSLLLGKLLDKRRFHTIHTLASEIGLHYRSVEDHLVLHGVLTQDAIKRDGKHLLIDVDHAEAILARYQKSITLREATAILGLGPRQGIQAARDGLLQPILNKAHYGRMVPTYDRSTVELFRNRLLDMARSLSESGSSFVTIDKAVMMTNIGLCEMLRMILDGKVRGLSINPNLPGVRGILISENWVKALMRRSRASCLPRKQAAKILHVEDYVITHLLQLGVLNQPVQDADDPAKSNASGLDEKCFASFRSLYVSASEIAKEYGVIHTQVIVGFRVLGLTPSFDPKRIEAYIYDRAAAQSIVEQELKAPMGEEALRAACQRNSKNARVAAKAVTVVKRLRQAFERNALDHKMTRKADCVSE